MPIRQHIQQALANLLANKLRSFLAVLGILVGTASVVALVSSGQLATKKALDQFKALGTDLMAVSFYETNPTGNASGANDFDMDEVEGMYSFIPELKRVAPYTTLYVSMAYEGNRLNGGIIGVTDVLSATIKIKMMQGRFISFLDNYASYCVLGYKLYEQIYEVTKQNPLGTQIQLGPRIFTIVGIAEFWPENSFFNADINNSVIIPISASKVLSKYAKIHNIVMQLHQNTNIETVQNKINTYLMASAPTLKTFFRSASQLIDSMEKQHQIFTLLLGAIGGISLLVGGIGVMNVMLVSVAERRREIGIRMAVGARRKDIRTLFLIEAIFLGILGGIIGILVGILASYIIAKFSNWDFVILILPPILGFLVSAATGIFFGFYPAHRASKLNPIETLRYE